MTSAQLRTLKTEIQKNPSKSTPGDQANIETALREREVLEQN